MDKEELPLKRLMGELKKKTALLEETKEKLEKSEERYRKQFEEALDAIFVADAETGIIIDCNRAASELVGREKSELIGNHQQILHPPEEIKGEFSSTFKQHLKEKKGQVLETQVITKKGEVKDVAIKANLFELEGKKVLLGIFRDITERKRAEEKLRESEKRFRDIAANTGDWIWEVDADGKYTYASPVVERVLGYKPEEVIGKHFYDFFHPDERERLKDAAFEVFTRKERFVGFVNRNVHKDGHVVILETSGIPIIDPDGQLLGYRGADRDITERKQIEDKLRESERKYKLLFESTLDGMFVLDAETMKVVLANQAAAKMYGFNSVEEVVGVNPLDFVPLENRDRVLKIIAKDMFEKDLRQTNEFRTITKDGRKIWISAVGTRTEYQGRLAGLISFRDITERRLTEELLRNAEEDWRNSFNSLEDVMLIIDRDYNIENINEIGLKLLGKSKEEIIGKKCYQVIAGKDSPVENCPCMKSLETKKVELLDRYEERFGKYYSIQTSPIFDENGEIIKFVDLRRDITERKKAEKAIKESEEKYRTITENINVGIYRNTPGTKGKFIEANPAIVKMFGYDKKEDFLKFNVSDLYQNPGDRKKFNQKMLKDGFVRNEEIQLKKKDGTPFWGSATAVAIRDEKGTIKYYDGMIDDITKRKEMEENLKKSYEETKMALEGEREFIEKTSHNFFNPLCIAKGYIALQLERDIPEETRKEVESAKRAIERIEKIVKKSVGRG